jgi:hypothetical protein
VRWDLRGTRGAVLVSRTMVRGLRDGCLGMERGASVKWMGICL